MRRSAALATESAPMRRCAIYTRKSTTAGLEQEFNSLDAQREACEQYILAQSRAGWQCLAETYDDGGYTGANIDRPAFTRLLADVDAGKIDVVVCYKIDRISRSLLDFTTVMNRLNQADVAFVSVTQHFSTADAAGRLTLNLLATFAEFEREMIAERTRDKMRAARRRGRWTGGPVPLGYQVVEKKLVVDELEALAVREVFEAYLQYRSVLAVTESLNERGRVTKRHKGLNGNVREARAWTKSDVLRLLKNSLYAGYMSYGEERHEGEHAAIVDRETFEQVATLLKEAAGARATTGRNPDYILRGVLFCGGCGGAFTPASTRKGGREFRYYRCTTRDKKGRAACASKPLPAPAIEEYVAAQIREATAGGNLASEVAESVSARVAARRATLSEEQRRLPPEVAALSTEGRRLAEMTGTSDGRARALLERRLEEVAGQAERYEARLAEVNREIAALDETEVEAGWITECLSSFDAVWDALTPHNRGRLVRAVVERIEIDEKNNRVQTFLADLGNGRLGDADRLANREVA